MKQLLEEARQMVRIGSVSTSGNEELANYASSLLQSYGIKTQLQQVFHSQENVAKRQFNVLGILGDPLVDKKTRKGLLLSTHLDTTTPGLSENWTETGGNPFGLTAKDGKLYGLGVADAKLDFLCKVHAAAKFREKKLRMPIYVVGTCGHELGMFGAKYLIKSMALNPKFVAVGAPTDLKVVHAHKQMSVFKISIGYQLVERDARGFNRRSDLYSFGNSAHGCCPKYGKNAISQALSFLSESAESGFDLRFTSFDGGETLNKVPDRAMIQFYLTSHQFEDFKRFFRERVRALGLEKAFRVELGGLGDAGVRFLPDVLFPCVMDVINFFKNLSAGFEQQGETGYDPASSTINFSQLKHRLGGVDLYFDLRLVPGVPPEETEKQIMLGVQAIASRYPSLNIVTNKEQSNPALNMTLQHELVRVCRDAMLAASLNVAFDKMSASTEASLHFNAGYETVVFGPGRLSGNSRSPNESIPLEQLEGAVAFYEKLIERICL